MTLAAIFLGGARSRLLPASIPFRYFACAIGFHVAGWAMLIYAAPEVAGFAGGLGPVLAALHLITLGVLTMTAIGAALQLLPVATRQALPALWPARLIFWVFVPGTVLTTYGMASVAMPLLVIGGLATGLALSAFGILLADNLRRATSLPVVAAFGWVAVVSLFAMAALGVVLVADAERGFLADRLAVAQAHVVLAAFGFMGMLALGFSFILVPMFALSAAPNQRLGWLSLACTTLALVLAVGGLLLGQDSAVVVAALIGLIGAILYLWTMRQVLTNRMRKRLGLSFLVIRGAWALLPVSLLLGGAIVLDLAGPRGPALFGFMLIFGWLLTFLLGVLQRILPFLASMHGARRGGKAPLVSELTAETPLTVHAFCHFGALALIAMGIVLDSAPLIRIGALVGLLGALAYGLFALLLFNRLHRGVALRHADLQS